ncbi:MAG: UDP-galactopyranose mutase [Lachnospiraceae bacterium]|nr:UDP-galactopyranose mutase [Lachnospiraceae bacterium]
MKQYDYLIVGAGLFGATFAYEMTKRGKSCLVIEKRGHIAGNIYTKKQLDIQVHKYGAHIFHTSNKKVWDYVNQFAEFNHYVNSPVAVYKDELYNLPFNMNTFHQMWGVRTPMQAKRKIAEQIEALNITEPQNLEEQALSLVGTDVYEKLFKGYTEKQWGRDCKELPAFIIKRLPLRFIYDNNYFNDPYQGIPKGGYTQIVEKMLDGIDVIRGTSFQDFVGKFDGKSLSIEGELSGISEDGQYGWKRTLYTGMIDEYFNFQLGNLEYRSLRFETEEKPEEDNYQGNAVVNYTEREIPFTRIIEHKHFEFGKGEGTVITREYPAEWKPGEEPYYPINNGKNNTLYTAYENLAKNEQQVLFGGRLGQYKYFDMDKTIEEALNLVDQEVAREDGVTIYKK